MSGGPAPSRARLSPSSPTFVPRSKLLRYADRPLRHPRQARNDDPSRIVVQAPPHRVEVLDRILRTQKGKCNER